MHADSDFIKSYVILRSTATRNLLLFDGSVAREISRFLVVPLRSTPRNDMGFGKSALIRVHPRE
jgi:hypothetical protein